MNPETVYSNYKERYDKYERLNSWGVPILDNDTSYDEYAEYYDRRDILRTIEQESKITSQVATVNALYDLLDMIDSLTLKAPEDYSASEVEKICYEDGVVAMHKEIKALIEKEIVGLRKN